MILKRALCKNKFEIFQFQTALTDETLKAGVISDHSSLLLRKSGENDTVTRKIKEAFGQLPAISTLQDDSVKTHPLNSLPSENGRLLPCFE